MIRSISLFLLSGICEIGGGYCIWRWLREGKPVWYGILGAITMTLYGIVATFQPEGFGRTYAAYGGFFIVLSLLWAWKADNFSPDKYDIIGASIALVGVMIIYYGPRN